MDIGSAAKSSGAEWIGRPTHEELQPKTRPMLPADDPFYQPPASNTPNPARYCAPGTWNWPSSG
jgi:hypothetical protein